MSISFWNRHEDAGLDFNGEEYENYGFSDFSFLTNLSRFDVPYAHLPSLLAPVVKHPEYHSHRSNPYDLLNNANMCALLGCQGHPIASKTGNKK